MPSNEVGDKVRNFFGQEKLLQGQHQGQTADGNWTGLQNSPWAGSQRQIGASFLSNSKNHNGHQSGSDGGQSFNLHHGLNFAQSNLGPEFSRNQSHNQQPNLNGYVHGHQIFQTGQSEANSLGVDPDFKKKSLVRLEASDSPVSFDFFGGQQQKNGGNVSMMQSWPKQQPGISDMQLLQQQAFVAQLQELQRQQQLHQMDTRHHSSMNQASSIGKHAAANQCPEYINGVPINEVSNHPWQPNHMATNTRWPQHGASAIMQGSSSGLMFPSEKNSALCLMGAVPQQADQFLYGVPNRKSMTSPNSFIQMDNPTMQEISVDRNSFQGNQHTTFPDQVDMQGGTSVSRSNFQDMNMFRATTGEGLDSGLNSVNLQQLNTQQRNAALQDSHGRQELAGSSESLREKTVMQVPPSGNVATLDPTEEKILYGSDDSLWDAFGGSASLGAGGYDISDGTESYNGFSSLQSGTWSALMQSAVAETSSDDVRLQEDWGGLSSWNAEPAISNQHPSSFNDYGKFQPAWDDSNSQTASNLNCRSSAISVDANRPNNSSNYSSIPGFQQPGLKVSLEPSEGLRTGSLQRFISQSTGSSKMLDHSHLQKPLSEGSHHHRNLNYSLGAETNANNVSGSWTCQQDISSYDSTNHAFKINDLNFMGSMAQDRGGDLKNHGNQNSTQTRQVGDNKRASNEEMSHGSVMWRTDSVPYSNVQLQDTKPASDSPQSCNERSGSKNDAAVPSFSNLRADQEVRQQLPRSHESAFWKDADSSVKFKGGNFLGQYQSHPDRSEILNSSGISSLDKEVTKMQKGSSNEKKNLQNSFHSTVSDPAFGSQEKFWLDSNDAHTMPGSKQNSSGNAGRKQSGPRKFQYHPMGDLGADVGTKHVTYSAVTDQQHSQGFNGHDQGATLQSKPCHTDSNSIETGKGAYRGSGEITSKRMMSDFTPVGSSSSDKSVGYDAPYKISPASQNMLELLHKVDQAREYGKMAHSIPSNCSPSSEIPGAESFDGYVGLKRSQNSVSQGFGLQLAPPSQRPTMPENALYSNSSSQTVMSSTQVTSGMKEKGHTWLSPTAAIQSVPSSQEPSQGDSRDNVSGPLGYTGMKVQQLNTQGSFSAASSSGSPFSSHDFQNQQKTVNRPANISSEVLAFHSTQMDDSCERVYTSQSASVPGISASSPKNNLFFSGEGIQMSSANTSHAINPAQQIRESESMPTAQEGAFSKASPNVWSSVSSHQHLLGSQTSKVASNLFKPYHQPNNNLGRNFTLPTNLAGQYTQEVANDPTQSWSMNSKTFVGREQLVNQSPGQQVSSENIESPQQTSSSSHGKEFFGKQQSDASPFGPSAIQRDIEAFSHSLRPSNGSHQNHYISEMQDMMHTEVSTTERNEKSKGPDRGVGLQQATLEGGQHLSPGYNNIVESLNHRSIASGDLNLLNVSTKMGDGVHTNTISQDGVAFVQNNSHNGSSNNTFSVIGEHSQINPQMALSCFDQHGILKNGQMLPSYPVQNISTMKLMDRPLIVGRPFDGLNSNPTEQAYAGLDASQLRGQQTSILTSIAPENISSSDRLSPVIADQSLVVVRPRKRKNSTAKLVAWHKEVTGDSENPQNISMAEEDWSQSANRWFEKVEDESEMIEDGQGMFKQKKRLLLTTQLMQQLLQPPPSAVFSVDASSSYEIVAYITARLSLGDACNATTSSSGSDSSLLPDSKNLLSEKSKTSAEIGYKNFANATEGFIARARKLEEDLLRLERRPSFLDLRVEGQDMEKFSVINCFAKFHSRGQADGAENPSSSGSSLNYRSFPQRYVTVLPLPRDLPDRVQCLSL